MKSSLLPVVLLCLFICGVQGQERVDKWTSSTGQTVDAEYVKLEGETLTIRMNGQQCLFSFVSPQKRSFQRRPSGDSF